MDKNIWLSIGILIAIILLGVTAIALRKKGRLPPDYKSFFYIGILWMAVGLIAIRENYFFFIMGTAFTIIGLSHKKDWEKNRRKWNDLSMREKRIKIGLAIALAFLIAAGFVIFLIKQ